MIDEIDKVLPDYFDYEIIADAATTGRFEVNLYLGAGPEGECVGEGKQRKVYPRGHARFP